MRKVVYEVKRENADTFYVSTYQEALKFKEEYSVKEVLIPTTPLRENIGTDDSIEYLIGGLKCKI